MTMPILTCLQKLSRVYFFRAFRMLTSCKWPE